MAAHGKMIILLIMIYDVDMLVCLWDESLLQSLNLLNVSLFVCVFLMKLSRFLQACSILPFIRWTAQAIR